MNTRTLALVASLSLLAGCKTVHVLGPDQLQRLDGYDAAEVPQQAPKLETRTGEVVSFKQGDELTLVRPMSAPHTGAIRHITVRNDRLVATLVTGSPFSVDLKPVTEVRLITPSPWKTALLVAGSILLGSAIVTGLTFLTIEVVHAIGSIRIFSFGDWRF